MTNKQYWSATEGVFNCLIDQDRTMAFAAAIQNTIRPGDVVVDIRSSFLSRGSSREKASGIGSHLPIAHARASVPWSIRSPWHHVRESCVTMRAPKTLMNWMHPGLAIRKSPRYGKSVYAWNTISAGSKLAVFGGHVMRIADEPALPDYGVDFALQIDDEFVIGAHSAADMDDAQYFNHSCDPNAGLRGQVGLVAMRDIAAEEDVTFDYAMVLADAPGLPAYEFESLCGSVLCRGTVTDRDWRLPELRRRYAGFFSWHVAERIKRSSA